LKITDQTDRDPQLGQQKTGQNSSLTVVGQGKSPKKEELGKWPEERGARKPEAARVGQLHKPFAPPLFNLCLPSLCLYALNGSEI